MPEEIANNLDETVEKIARQAEGLLDFGPAQA